MAALVAFFMGAAAGTTPAGAASFTYDGPAIALVDAAAIGAADVSTAQLSVAHEGSATPSVEARGPSTTPLVRNIATSSGKPFGELASPSDINNAGSPIRSFVTEADTTYYRVYSGHSTAGRFLSGAPPASADDAVRGLALPPSNRADFIQEVTVPAGTRLQSSIATRAFGQEGGMLQFELLERIPTSNFGPGRAFR